MMKLNKKGIRIHIVILALLIMTLSVMPAFASKMYLKEDTVGNGKTLLWYPTNNTNGWNIQSTDTATIYIALTTAETNVRYGLQATSTGTKTQFGSFSGSTTSIASKKPSSSTNYKVYVTNNAATTITVTNSSYINF